MKKGYLLLALSSSLVALRSEVSAQYGNEWINYNLKYYKIKVANDGIYRIDSLALTKAGISVASNDSRYYKLFYRGQEQYIYVNAQSPTNFSEVKSNYIEFYGLHNDGTLDSLVYYNISFLPNPYYSLFNDSSSYYLTYDPSSFGKRMTELDSVNFNSHTPNAYFMTSTVNQQNSEFIEGARIVDGLFTVNDPRFTQSEGWTDAQISNGSSATFNPNVQNVYTGTGAPNAFIRSVFMGTDASTSKQVSVYSNIGPLWTNVNFAGFKAIDTTISLSPVNAAINTITFNNTASSSGLIAPSYIYIDYPHTLNMAASTAFTMDVPDGSSGMAYLDMTNFKASVSDTVRFYDLTNHYRFVVTNAGGFYKVLIPNSGALKHCFMTSDSLVNHVKSPIPVGINGDGKFYNFTTVTANGAYIIITHPKLWAAASAYAAYRQSKNYQTVMADINELYDQFGYGVDYSPLGIRRFCNYAINNWPKPSPSYLFLIGKGIHTPLFRNRDSTALDSDVLVPSFGYPSSDILFTNGLGTSTLLQPAIPTGRIAAENPAEVYTYLSKVQAYEAWNPALWQKKVVHFAGGADATDESYFAGMLYAFASQITGPLFGADIYNFSKSSPSPLGITLADSIMNLINGGVSIMTFCGHASGRDWDFSLDYPSDYNNGNRYPLIIADACFSGDIFQPVGQALSVSEQWVLTAPGSIGFLASDYVGNPPELETYTWQLYKDFDSSYYHKSIGKIMQNTIGAVQNANDLFMTCTCLEMTFHGDPAITLCQYDTLPDYAVTDSSIYFTPANITVESDSFDVHVIVSNYAKAINQPVIVAVTRFFPNGKDTNYLRTLKNIYFQDTLTIRMPVDHVNGVGLNHFCVDADPSNLLPEITYSNNNVCNIPILITSGDIIPVWPYDYAIIPAPQDTVMLKASTGDPFAPQRTYIFEIDTTDLFNSHWGKSQLVTQSGGVVCAPSAGWEDTLYHKPVKEIAIRKTGIESLPQTPKGALSDRAMNNTTQSPPKADFGQTKKETTQTPITQSPFRGLGHDLRQSTKNTSKNSTFKIQHSILTKPHAPVSKLNLTNGQVYYWRVRRDTTDVKDYLWTESSFQYLKGYTGWGQSQYFQFMDDELFQDQYNFIDTNDKKRQWYFSLSGKQLQCNTYGTPDYNIILLTATQYTIDDYIEAYGGCNLTPGIYVAIIDPVSINPWSTQYYRMGNDNYTGNILGCATPQNKFIYWDNSKAQMDSLVYFLKNVVPNGFYILAYSWGEGYYKMPGLADTAIIGEFAALGATQMEIRKTTPGLDSLPFIFFVQKGNPKSAQQLYGRNSTDSLQLSVVLSANGAYGSIVTPFIGPAAKYDSLSWFQHPLNHSTTDSVRLNIMGMESNGTVKTLIADILPAIANMYISSINPKVYPYIQLMLYTKDMVAHTPAQMNWWRVFYTPVPELAVNPNIYTYYHKDTLATGDTLRFKTVVQNISDYPMDTTLLHTWIMDQHYNTAYSTYTKVKKLNPGDTSMLSMTWASTNSYMGNNSVWFEVNPEDLPQTRLEQYHFNNLAEKTFNSFGDRINPLLDVTFNGIHILNNDIVSPTPDILITVMDENKYLALNNPNDVQVYIRNITNPTPLPVSYGPLLSFTPATEPHNKCSVLYTPTLTDGTYELTVQATDISGNQSAVNSYKIDFQVITKSMISEVLNYPNPFSTSTRFVFILTGDQIPTTFKIQIMTVTGKIIRELTESEIGPIHIGRNITQYAWDGTDQFGSKLANGVYLYRVVSSINGQSIDNYSTGADKYFTKNWGKMYIIR